MAADYWFVFKKDDQKLFNIIGKGSDDTELTNNTSILQKLGYAVRCETVEGTLPKEQIIAEYSKISYNEKPGLYDSILKDIPPEVANDDSGKGKTQEEKATYKEHSSTQQRITKPRHHIDAGFVNRRKCFSVFGTKYIAAFSKIKQPGSDHYSVLLNDHYMIHLALDYCHQNNTPTLGQFLQNPIVNSLFCSTEKIQGCGDDVYNSKRARNQILLPFDFEKQLFIEYHTEHVLASTERLLLSQGSKTSLIAELFSNNEHEMVFHPLIMGPPTFDHFENKKIGYDLTWAGWSHFELYPEDIDEFNKCSSLAAADYGTWSIVMQSLSEDKVKDCFCKIFGDSKSNDWGGEDYDHFTSHVHLSGVRKKAAFLFKGPARFEEMQPRHLGKNADQIFRLSRSNADVLIVQHCHEIGEAVRETLRAFAASPSCPKHYCLIDGRDTFRILKAYSMI
jgi:hypothetical protein